MNYFPLLFSPEFWSSPDYRQTDRQTESDAYEPTVQLAQVGSKNGIRDPSRIRCCIFGGSLHHIKLEFTIGKFWQATGVINVNTQYFLK